MKNFLIGMLVIGAASAVFATIQQGKTPDDCCGSKAAVATTKAPATKDGDCCGTKATMASTKAKAANQDDCCGAKATMASTKAPKSEDECCKSTAAKKMAKGDKGCCNEVGSLAKFKLFIDGKYLYYGCKESAEKARTAWGPKAFTLGQVQKVVGKVRIPANQPS